MAIVCYHHHNFLLEVIHLGCTDSPPGNVCTKKMHFMFHLFVLSLSSGIVSYLFLFGLGRALKLNALCCFIFACLGGWCPSSALFCALFISSEHLPWWQLAGGSEVDVPWLPHTLLSFLRVVIPGQPNLLPPAYVSQTLPVPGVFSEVDGVLMSVKWRLCSCSFSLAPPTFCCLFQYVQL